MEKLQLSTSTFYSKVKRGEIPVIAHPLSSRNHRYPADEIDKLAEKLQMFRSLTT